MIGLSDGVTQEGSAGRRLVVPVQGVGWDAGNPRPVESEA